MDFRDEINIHRDKNLQEATGFTVQTILTSEK